VNVAAVARGEVARGGLALLLEKVPGGGDYAVFEPAEFTDTALADTIQLLVLSYHVLLLWCGSGSGAGADAWAADLAAVARKNGIRVVLLLPAAEVARAASEPTMPCDGVLDQDALTAAGLVDAVQRLAAGERLGAAAVAPVERVVEEPVGSGAGAALTTRERQVLRLLVDGLSNKQIGQALGLSEHGAKRLVASVLAKLQSPNRTQAVAIALRDGLLEGP
jgi:DNA-binding NarL/FixJ family response regulator